MPLDPRSSDAALNALATTIYHAKELEGDAAFQAGDWTKAKSAYEDAKEKRELSSRLHVRNHIPDSRDHAGAILHLQLMINMCQTNLDAAARAAQDATRIATHHGAWVRPPPR